MLAVVDVGRVQHGEVADGGRLRRVPDRGSPIFPQTEFFSIFFFFFRTGQKIFTTHLLPHQKIFTCVVCGFPSFEAPAPDFYMLKKQLLLKQIFQKQLDILNTFLHA